MKSILVSIVAAVLVGCGESQQSSSTDEEKPVEPVARSSQPPKNSAKIKAPKVPIHKAAYEGNFEIVKQHLAAGTDVNKETDFIAFTPLHQAAAGGHMSIASLLIEKGANVNANGSGKGSPLLVAANAGHKEITELLIEKGADVNSADDDGSTSLDWAESEEHKEVAALLRKHGGKTGAELWAEESIFGAASLGDIQAVKKHLATGTDVNSKDEEYGAIPLHRAAGGRHKEVVALLITKGADVNIEDVDSETPLDWAESEEHKETADLLRKHGGKTGEELKAAAN